MDSRMERERSSRTTSGPHQRRELHAFPGASTSNASRSPSRRRAHRSSLTGGLDEAQLAREEEGEEEEEEKRRATRRRRRKDSDSAGVPHHERALERERERENHEDTAIEREDFAAVSLLRDSMSPTRDGEHWAAANVSTASRRTRHAATSGTAEAGASSAAAGVARYADDDGRSATTSVATTMLTTRSGKRARRPRAERVVEGGGKSKGRSKLGAEYASGFAHVDDDAAAVLMGLQEDEPRGHETCEESVTSAAEASRSGFPLSGSTTEARGKRERVKSGLSVTSKQSRARSHHLALATRELSTSPLDTDADADADALAPSDGKSRRPTRGQQSGASVMSARSNATGVARGKREFLPTIEQRVFQDRPARVNPTGAADSPSAATARDSPLRRAARSLGEALRPLGDASSRFIALMLLLALAYGLRWAVSSVSDSGQGRNDGELERERELTRLMSSWLARSRVAPLLARFSDAPTSQDDVALPAPLRVCHALLLALLSRLVPLKGLSNGEEEPTPSNTAMRGYALASDALVFATAVCLWSLKRANEARAPSRRRTSAARDRTSRAALVNCATILMQPALLLLDYGFFGHLSIALGLVLWSLIAINGAHDLAAVVAFVCALSFDPAAAIFLPAMLAYIIGRALFLRQSFSLLAKSTLVALASALVVAWPSTVFGGDAAPATAATQRASANVWSLLDESVGLPGVVASHVTLFGSLSVVASTLPTALGFIYVASQQEPREGDKARLAAVSLLPHTLFVSSVACVLLAPPFWFAAALPLVLLPLALMMSTRELGHGRGEWEWGALVVNVVTFTLWPRARDARLAPLYAALAVGWNVLIGYDPTALRSGTFIKPLSLLVCACMVGLHTLELAHGPSHTLQMLSTALSIAVFTLAGLWATKRFAQEAWALVGLAGSGGELTTARSRAPSLAPSSVSGTSRASSKGRRKRAAQRAMPEPMPSLSLSLAPRERVLSNNNTDRVAQWRRGAAAASTGSRT